MTPGAKLAQSCHVAFSFAHEHTQIVNTWMKDSNYLVVLELEELDTVIEQAKINNIEFSIFMEPDMNNIITAVALEPGDKSRRLCARIPLALRKY